MAVTGCRFHPFSAQSFWPFVERNGLMRVRDPLADESLTSVFTELGLSQEICAQLGALWGKSRKVGGGQINLLVSHLLDTAAVAGQLWDFYLPQQTKRLLNHISDGQGRRFFMWLCAVHDCGKACPAFQSVDAEGAALVRAAGLTWVDRRLRRKRWRHDKAGGKLLHAVLGAEWDGKHTEWVWPLVAGHHRAFPSKAVLGSVEATGEHQGRGGWPTVQRALLDVVTRVMGYEHLRQVQPHVVPSRAEQLTLSALIVMADWIASDSRPGRFTGIDAIADVSPAGAKRRASAAVKSLRLRGGWGPLEEPPAEDLVRHRFGDRSRPFQKTLVDVVRQMPEPGLVLVEAPMGEGKTKGALAGAEVMAARFGSDGVFIGMPTQATSDPIYSQVCRWVAGFDEELVAQVALLHGKKMFHPEWKELWSARDGSPDAPFEGVDCDEFGMEDTYGLGGAVVSERSGPALWFLGRNRGLLTAFAVGTIDQLLFAATRTRHVMLRFAGLAGKVVILDEVHAADVYMSQFLTEALRWLGQARVPVILLSATLPPPQRRALVDAYLHGALPQEDVPLDHIPTPEGYPSITAAYAVEGRAAYICRSTGTWRRSQQVEVQWLEDVSDEGDVVADRVRREVTDGGVALVILNKVDRAQSVYQHLEASFPSQVHLLHGRLCAAHRAERTSACVATLGPGAQRPERMIIVATQVAEQSFDVDADLLVTDLAPIDLLLQRIGRLHRHEGIWRPEHLRRPRVLVTGAVPSASPLRVHPASEAIYGRYLLLRTAALVEEAVETTRKATSELKAGDGGWLIPAQVPELVAAGYGDDALCVPGIRDEEHKAYQEWREQEQNRAAAAEPFLLARRDEWSKPTLEGLHFTGISAREEQDLQALVRDGQSSLEAVIVRRVSGGYTALSGEPIGVHAEATEYAREAVLGGLTRLPAQLTEAARELAPLDGWRDDPWLRHFPAMVLEEDGWAHLGDYRVGYDSELGLIVRKTN
ncbi:CRISPR-associated helicase Cas3' [Nocardiopsis rhodophaea]